ncbi:HNH endonuclease [Polynucleobacter hirudinilacicola]|uniref:HNH endonuclease n=1 Tax=Polynucleobacter hirudinilacicola TaxID=1743166 RepID=UPI0038B24617
MLSILKLDAGGIPQGWVNAEEATKHYADSSVIWTLGDPIMKMRGGISRASGLQSVIELHSIIAINGSAKINLFDVVPVITKHKLFKRDRGLCAYCGDAIHENQAEAEHIIPNSRGGKYSWMNLVISCRPCNQRKGNRTPEQAGMGLLYTPYLPSLYEDMILKGRNILADQMDFLAANLPRNSRLLEGIL